MNYVWIHVDGEVLPDLPTGLHFTLVICWLPLDHMSWIIYLRHNLVMEVCLLLLLTTPSLVKPTCFPNEFQNYGIISKHQTQTQTQIGNTEMNPIFFIIQLFDSRVPSTTSTCSGNLWLQFAPNEYYGGPRDRCKTNWNCDSWLRWESIKGMDLDMW